MIFLIRFWHRLRLFDVMTEAEADPGSELCRKEVLACPGEES